MNFKDLKRSYINSDPTCETALGGNLLEDVSFRCEKRESLRTDKTLWSITVSYKGREVDYVVVAEKEPTMREFLKLLITMANKAMLNDYFSWCSINSIIPDETAEELYKKHRDMAARVMKLFGDDIDLILEELERDGYSFL